MERAGLRGRLPALQKACRADHAVVLESLGDVIALAAEVLSLRKKHFSLHKTNSRLMGNVN